MHDEEAAGDLAFGLGALAVGYGCVTDLATKERAEGSQTLKSHFKANVRNAEIVTTKQLLCLLDTTFDQILVRSFIERLPEEAEKIPPVRLMVGC